MENLNKNILTDNQKIIKEVIDKIHKELKNKCIRGVVDEYDIDQIIKKVNRDYQLMPQYDTLEEYIKEHESGAYHHFIFYLDGRRFEGCNLYDFKTYYNPHILERFVVIEDEQKDNGGDCETYKCVHNLKIKRREEFE